MKKQQNEPSMKSEPTGGRYTVELVCAQANIPKEIYEAIRKKAESEGFSMSTYFRRWIVNSYKEESKKW